MGLKPETVDKIKELLQFDVDERRSRLLNMIEQGYAGGLDARIKEYQEAYNANEDFAGWIDRGWRLANASKA